MTPKQLGLPLLGVLIGLMACTPQKAPVQMTWELLGNDSTGICRSALTLHNISRHEIASDWALYYNQMSVAPLANEQEQVHITQIMASYHSLTPTALFEPLAPHQSRTFILRHKGSITRLSGMPQGAFWVQGDQKPQKVTIEAVVSNDRHEYRKPFDRYEYADGDFCYRFNEPFQPRSEYKESVLPVLPTPKQVWQGAKREDLDTVVSVQAEPRFQKEALYLQAQLEALGIRCEQEHGMPIILEGESDFLLEKEGYYLSIEDTSVVMTGADEAGMFYACQTLLQLFENQQLGHPIGYQYRIIDYPELPYRGQMIDLARNYMGRDELYKLIDEMARYKLNVLHLHLSDDEGWRLQIRALPELTEVGSRRGYTTDERDCLYPAYCGGFDPDDLTSPANGYLSEEDYIQLLQYANERHITVVPEMDMPAHSRAAIKSMEARYERYKASDSLKANEYLLTDKDDQSVYESAQHYTDNALCVGKSSCLHFVETVLDALLEMHQKAGVPLRYFHAGGDEIPKGAWEKSPICQSKMQELGLETTADLKDYFMQEVSHLAAQKGVQLLGWEDIALRGKQANLHIDPQVICYCWNSVPNNGQDDPTYVLANAGFRVVCCGVTNVYLDMAYCNHEEEQGLNWGGYTNAYTAFQLQPYSIYQSVPKNAKGTGEPRLQEAKRGNIYGVLGALWAETLRTPQQAERYLFPKLLGLAERAWNSETVVAGEAEKLYQFHQQVQSYELPRLQKHQIHFHMAQPGIRAVGDTIEMNALYEGTEIHYTLDGTTPNRQSPRYERPFYTTASLVKAKSYGLGEESNTTILCR